MPNIPFHRCTAPPTPRIQSCSHGRCPSQTRIQPRPDRGKPDLCPPSPHSNQCPPSSLRSNRCGGGSTPDGRNVLPLPKSRAGCFTSDQPSVLRCRQGAPQGCLAAMKSGAGRAARPRVNQVSCRSSACGASCRAARLSAIRNGACRAYWAHHATSTTRAPFMTCSMAPARAACPR
jgi:hypothetical protein